MKKVSVLVLALVLVFAVSSLASAQSFFQDGNWEAKMGMDFMGKYTYGSADPVDVKSGFTVAGEYLVNYEENMDMGIGLSYQFNRELKDTGYGFNFIPFYGVIKMETEMGDYAPYFLGQLGYNLLKSKDAPSGTELKGGIYYGIGAGMAMGEDMNAELLYSVNNGEADGTDVKYSKVRLGVSLAF